ncbi:erythromycin esterase family protein [Lentzea guizhouensis]|uniref:erythromycin esterase family protein n=1 Tax=Lentzea guizhouensis TaxID=1586287 RepID=UPI001F2DAE37|nr:erythromycin esterase family protein [Lentzea guizhouensis]
MRTTPLDDLSWLDEAIGDARVVALGESAHYNRETYLLRHRVFQHLVERHGFTAYAMETGFTEARTVLTDDVSHALANGLTSFTGIWTEMRAHLEWQRTTDARFYGIDLGGANASLVPGLAALPGVPDDLRETAAFGAESAYSAPAAFGRYAALPQATRDALTAGIAELRARLAADPADPAVVRSAHLVAALDLVIRAMARGDQREAMTVRDAAMADTVSWILEREERVLLVAHNGHLQRWPGVMPGMEAMVPLGLHLADRLGDDYLVIGATNGTGQTLHHGPEFFAGRFFADLPAPEPGSLDAFMGQHGDEPFAVDLRRLSSADAADVRAASRQRFGPFYAELDATVAYDLVVHLPHVSAATFDTGALDASPEEVRNVLRAIAYG